MADKTTCDWPTTTTKSQCQMATILKSINMYTICVSISRSRRSAGRLASWPLTRCRRRRCCNKAVGTLMIRRGHCLVAWWR